MPKQISDDQKQKMQEGRTQQAAVSAYLNAIQPKRARRGPRRTEESILAGLAKAQAKIDDVNASTVDKLEAIQKRMDLNAELEELRLEPNMGALEEAFVAVAAAFSERKGISYAAWREMGVTPATLKAAGVRRGT